MITKIRLKNWKSHLDSEFDFTAGVNALIGINGAGKSSVLDAISFALFGTFPNHNNRKIGLDDLVMGRPQKKEEAEIYLEFFSSGKKYSVLRKLRKGKGTIQAEVREDGKLTEVNPSNVTEHIERILQIDYPLFSKAVYSEQNNIDFFLTIPKGKRMQHIDKMLNLDRFELARNSSGILKNIMQAGLSEKNRLVSEMKKENLAAKIGSSSKTIADLENTKKLTENEMIFVKVKIDEINKRLADTEIKEKRFLEIEKKLAELKSASREISINLGEKSKSPVPGTKESLETEMESIKKEAFDIENGLKKNKELLEDHRGKVASCNAQLKGLAESLLELDKIKGAICPVCENEIGENKKTSLKGERGRKIQLLKADLQEFIAEIGTLKGKIELLENTGRLRSREVDKLNYRIGEFELIERMENKLKILEIDIERFETEKKIIERGMQDSDVKKLRLDLSEKARQLGGLQSKTSSTEHLLKKELQILDELARRQQILRKQEDEISTFEKAVNLIESFMQALKLTQEQLREEFTKTVNSVMENIWGSLYPYSDFESVRLFITEGDYVLEAKNSGSWVPVDGVASGGERSLACLALRVAFSLAFIPNLKWLILDEPTHNLDANTIQKFSSVLRDDISKFVNQIFLITHEVRLVEDVEGAVYRLERDKSANGVTKIVKV